jgi:hypothetical protein
MLYLTATQILAILAALSTLALMAYAAQPWGDNAFYRGLLGYAWLLLMAVWATLHYLVLFIMAKRAVHSRAKKFFALLGALIIAGSGLAAYVDAIWLHPDPQSGLAFIAVPLYQWLIVGLLAAILWLANTITKIKR